MTSGPLPDGTAPLMQAWRVSLACWEDAGENTVHRVDGIRVTTEPFTEEGFPASGPEQTWLSPHFSVAADNTTPDGDGSVFQQFTPGGPFMTYSGNTVVPEYPIRLTAMVRVSDPAASTWARTDVGLRADNNDQIFVLVHGQVPSLIQLAHFAPFSETLSEFDTSSQFSLAPGDWVEVSLVVDEASVLYGVRKWLGTEWTESMSGAVHDAHLARDLRWRPVVRCDAQEGANSTHAVDRIRVEHLILTGATGSAAAPDAGAIAVTYRHGYVHVVSMGLSAGGTSWQAFLACALIAAAILLLRRRVMLLVLALAVGVFSPGRAGSMPSATSSS